MTTRRSDFAAQFVARNHERLADTNIFTDFDQPNKRGKKISSFQTKTQNLKTPISFTRLFLTFMMQSSKSKPVGKNLKQVYLYLCSESKAKLLACLAAIRAM
jgi:hypothetical protein